MNLVDRVKKILLSPKEEWVVIDQETTSVADLITKYLLPLALIPAIASLIGFGFLSGGAFLGWGIKQAIMSFLTTILSAYLAALVINALSSSFGSQNDFRKAMQLVIYSFTPMMVAGILYVIPSLGIIASLAGIYGLYILYLGFSPLMKTPEDKLVGYFIVSLIVIIAIYAILMAILAAILAVFFLTSVVTTIPHGM